MRDNLTLQHIHIIRNVISKGKGMVLVINKWDLIEKKTETMNDYIDNILYKYPSISHYPIIFILINIII